MPKQGYRIAEWRRRLLLALGEEWGRLNVTHNRLSPPTGCIAVGGEHMDPFFRMEAVRECQSSLRKGKSVEESVEDGKEASRTAVKMWNSRREYQVHRWVDTACDWLEGLVRRLRRDTG